MKEQRQEGKEERAEQRRETGRLQVLPDLSPGSAQQLSKSSQESQCKRGRFCPLV